MENYYTKSSKEVISQLKTSMQDGLTEEEAKKRLEKNGENKIESGKKTNYFLKFLSQFKDVMVLILICAAIVSLIFAIVQKSSTELIDAIIIFVIVLINATLGFFQEIKAENALESLKKMSQPYSTVIRDGEEKKVKTAELVVGDIVLLEAGDVVPADLLLIDSASLKCEEASLTGESLPVEKQSGVVLQDKTPLAERKNMCFSSTTVAYGRGRGVVVATGKNAEIGKIASMLTSQKKETTPIQKSLNKLGEVITFIVLGIAIVIFLCDILITHQNWIDSFLTAVAIAVAAIPESLPAVVTIILSIGVTRLAKKNTIIKKLHAVETLGCCQVICSDKTGTITQNKMTVREFYANNTLKTVTVDEVLKQDNIEQLLKCMTLCNDARKQKDNYIGDPTETALIQFAEKFGISKHSLELKNKRVGEIPFDSNRKLMTTVNLEEDTLTQYTKGGVDEILEKCSHILINNEIRKITLKDIEQIKKANEEMCKKALRVLAYSTKNLSQDIKPNNQANVKDLKTYEQINIPLSHQSTISNEQNLQGDNKLESKSNSNSTNNLAELQQSNSIKSLGQINNLSLSKNGQSNISNIDATNGTVWGQKEPLYDQNGRIKTAEIQEKNLVFIGLTGMIDPPREEVFSALIKCKEAGMKAIMITGDHKDTATAIAKELGMITSDKQVVNGAYLDKFTDKQLAKIITEYTVFTRVSPEHKVRIVKALQANGKVVAMTGDGVNDAPSIKSANIGIGMGITGTEVTKDVADMILTDDNFATIVLAVEEGRKIFGNIQKTIGLLLSCNIAEVLAIFIITIFFPQYTFFSAVQILFINLVTDTFPAIALSANEAEKDCMKQPPRDPKKNIIAGRVGVNILYQGFVQTAIVIGVYLLGQMFYNSHALAITMSFITINLIQLFHMYNIRTSHSIFKSNPFGNKLVNIAFVFETCLLLLVALIPPVASIFGMTQMNLTQWLISVGGAFLIIPICEIVKLFQEKLTNKNNQ